MIMLTILLVALPVILVVALFSRKGISAKGAITVDRLQDQVFEQLSHPDDEVKFRYGRAAIAVIGATGPGTVELAVIYEKPVRSRATIKFERTAG